MFTLPLTIRKRKVTEGQIVSFGNREEKQIFAILFKSNGNRFFLFIRYIQKTVKESSTHANSTCASSTPTMVNITKGCEV